jgi:hypothetical protein
VIELLEARGLMSLERIGSQELVPSQVLEAAQRRTQAWGWSPTPGRTFQQRKFRRNVRDLKTLSESVLPSRAIRFIRNAVSSLDYGVQLKKINRKDKELQKQLSPVIDKILGVFDNPNTTDDDLQSFIAQIVEDVLVFDAGAWEYVEKPKFIPNNNLLAMETVPGFSLANKLDWDGNPQKPRWMQLMDDGRTGEQFLDSEIEYLSMRKRSWTPFGLSPLETVIDIMEAWLGITSYQRRVASEAYPPMLLNLQGQDQTQLNLVRSWWENEIKGRATPGFIGWPEDIQAIDMKPGGDTMLMLAYQEMLVRTVSYAFDLKPLDFSIERDVNRTTAEVQRVSSLRDGPKTLARMIQQKMNQRVLPKLAQMLNEPLVLKCEFFWLNIDPADDKAQAETYKVLVDSEIMLPDEARAELDLEQRPDGLGMMSSNALKELYTINPTAGMKKGALKNSVGLPEVPSRTPDLNQEVGLTQGN